MKRAHAARHRNLATQRRAASKHMDRRIEKESIAKGEARFRADRYHSDWRYGDVMRIEPLAYGAFAAPFGAARLLGQVR